MARLNKAGFLLLLLAVTVSGLPAGRARAQTPLPLDELGAGPRATAMGQAFTAVADDPSAAYYNPAGLVQIHTPFLLTVGYQYAKPRVWIHMDPVDLNFRNGDFSREEDPSTSGLYVGYACNFSEVSFFKDSPWWSRFAVGFTFFVNLPDLTQFWNPQWDTEPYLLRYNDRWSLFSLALSAAFRCTDWLSIGAGFLPRVDSLQTATGSWIQLPPEPDDMAVGFRLDLRQETKINVVPVCGLLVRPPSPSLRDRIAFGFSYRGKMSVYYGTGPQSTKVLWVKDPDNPIMIYDDPGGKIVDHVGFAPEQFTFALSGSPLPGLLLAFDVTWKRYSAFTFFWDLPPKPAFRDVWIPRIGLAYAFDPNLQARYLRKICEMTFLAGYYRETSPVKDMNGPMNLLDSDENVVSGGFAVRYDADWTGTVNLETFFQAHLLETSHIRNDEDPLYGPLSTGGQVWALGVFLSVVY